MSKDYQVHEPSLLAKFPFLLHKFNLPRPVVSFVFDKAPETAYHYGAAMLDHHQLRGTFYLQKSVKPRTGVVEPYQIADLHKRGHEIALGCHAETDDFFDALRLQKRDLARIIHDIPPINYSGSLSLLQKLQMGNYARSTLSKVDGINHGWVDRHLLKSVQLNVSSLTPRALDDVITENGNQNGWLIFSMNQVGKTAGTTFDLLQKAIRTCLSKGMAVMNVNEVLDFAGVPTTFNSVIGATGMGHNVQDVKRPVRFNPPVRVARSQMMDNAHL